MSKENLTRGASGASSAGDMSVDLPSPAPAPAPQTVRQPSSPREHRLAKKREQEAKVKLEHDHGFSSLREFKGPNPFKDHTSISGWYEKTKVFFMCITLIPFVRLLLCVLCLLLQWVLSSIILCFRITPDCKCLYWLLMLPIRFMCRVEMFLLGFYWVKVTVDDGCCACCSERAPVMVANHVSIVDHFMPIYHTGCTVAAADFIHRIPLVRTVLKASHSVPVVRETEVGRAASLERITNRAKQESWPPILVFPQGTTANEKTLTTFKRGAFWTGQPVRPVVIKFPNKHYDMLAGVASGMGYYAFRTMTQFVNWAEYHYLPIYHPSEAEKANPFLYAENVRKLLAKELGAHCTEHEYDDVRLMIAAHHAQIPEVDFVATDILDMFEFTTEEVVALGERFRQLDKNGSGTLTFDEFADGLGMSADKSVAKRLFKLFDTDETDDITFREFLVVIGVTTRGEPQADAIRILFEICDRNGDGVLLRSEMEEMMTLIHNICTDLHPTDSSQAKAQLQAVTSEAAAAGGPATAVVAALAAGVAAEDAYAKQFSSPFRLCSTLKQDIPLNTVLDKLFTPLTDEQKRKTEQGEEWGLNFEEFFHRFEDMPDFPRAVVRLVMLRRVGGLLPGVTVSSQEEPTGSPDAV